MAKKQTKDMTTGKADLELFDSHAVRSAVSAAV